MMTTTAEEAQNPHHLSVVLQEPLIDIKPPPPDPYELRVIIWGVR